MKKNILILTFCLLGVALFAQTKIDIESMAYKIGGTGPGGGLVFYMEGNRYLECSWNLGTATWDEAILIGKNYIGGGYDDWYLPNKEELNYIYENLHVLGHIEDNDWFWSSSEYSRNYSAWLQYFAIGTQYDLAEARHVNVRVVRAFYSDTVIKQ